MTTQAEVKTGSTLLGLAERCEHEIEPDRGLDIEITVAIDWRYPDWEPDEKTARQMAEKHGLAWLISRSVEGYNSTWRHLPRFTASLDAAMTLVPEGSDFTVGSDLAVGQAVASCSFVNNRVSGYVDVVAATPALALCAAALRARHDTGV